MWLIRSLLTIVFEIKLKQNNLKFITIIIFINFQLNQLNKIDKTVKLNSSLMLATNPKSNPIPNIF